VREYKTRKTNSLQCLIHDIIIMFSLRINNFIQIFILRHLKGLSSGSQFVFDFQSNSILLLHQIFYILLRASEYCSYGKMYLFL